MTLRSEGLAAADLRGPLAWIAEGDPKAATKVAARFRPAAETLTKHPGTGCPGHIEGTRQMLCVSRPFLDDCNGGPREIRRLR